MVSVPWAEMNSCRRSLQIRAANSLLSITHSMKLLLLLSDEAQIAHRRDLELQNVQKERDEIKEEVANLLTNLLHESRFQSTTG